MSIIKAAAGRIINTKDKAAITPKLGPSNKVTSIFILPFFFF